MAHPELGTRILDQVIEAGGPRGKIDSQARLEGRSMSMVMSPDKKAAEAARKAREAETSAAESGSAASVVVATETDDGPEESTIVSEEQES